MTDRSKCLDGNLHPASSEDMKITCQDISGGRARPNNPPHRMRVGRTRYYTGANTQALADAPDETQGHRMRAGRTRYYTGANTQALADAPDHSTPEAQRDLGEDRLQPRMEELHRMAFPSLYRREPPADDFTEVDRMLGRPPRALAPTRSPGPLRRTRFVPTESSRWPESSREMAPAASTQMSTEFEESGKEPDNEESTSYRAYRLAYLRLDGLGAVGEERRRYQAELQGAIDRMQREERIIRGTEP